MELRRRLSAERGLAVDVGLAVAVMAVIAVAIAADLGPGRRPNLIAYVFAIGLGLLMLVRRTYPSLTLIASAAGLLAYYVAGYPPIGLAVPMAAALYSAAERSRLWLAIGVAAALLVISYVYRLAVGQSPAYLFGYELAVTVGLMAGAIALGDAARGRRLLRAEAGRRQREAAAQSEREAERRVEAERLRIARDVHDVVAHTVVVVSLQADVATEAMADNPTAAMQALTTIRGAAGEASRQLRATVGLLRHPGEEEPRTPIGGLGDLDRLIQTTAGGRPRVEKCIRGDPAPLPTMVDTTAYRIIQESLSNALRHAEASMVTIALRYGRERLDIEVTDDGKGAPGVGRATKEGGSGLVGMRERAVLLGGTLSAENRVGGGFRVHACLPTAGMR